MMVDSLQSALNALATLDYPNLNHYREDALPNVLSRSDLPCLLVLPFGYHHSATANALETVAFTGGAHLVRFRLTHLLLIAPLMSGVGVRSHLPTLIQHIDAYLTTVSAHLTLDGALASPLQFSIQPNTYDYGGIRYVGCAFQHEWRVRVGG
ncbi:MAG: hypothetical protein ACOYLB_16540 [Phototrophicaceae bacterium]